MIDALKMKLNTLTPFGTHSKNYSDFVIREKPAKKISVLKKAAKAANADQRRMVKKAQRATKSK